MMSNVTEFGEMLKALRIEAGMTLREFCRKAGEDPANLSRIERSLRTAPCDDVVERYAKAIGIPCNKDLWHQFFDLAALSRREIPRDIASDAALVAKLPALLRTIRGEKPNDDDMEKALYVVKKAFRP